MKTGWIGAAACALLGVVVAPAQANVLSVSLDTVTGQILLTGYSFAKTGLNSSTGAVTEGFTDWAFTLAYPESILVAVESNTTKALGVKYAGHTILDPGLTGTFSLYSGTPGSGVLVHAVAGGVTTDAILPTGVPNTYSASIGQFDVSQGSYYLEAAYYYDPNYKSGSTYTSLPTGVHGVIGASLEGSATVTPAVPEASTWVMLGLGFAGVGLAGLRQRRTARSMV